MMQYIAAFVIAAIIFGMLDALWLNNVAVGMYESTVGHLMSEKLNMAPALAFYIIYLLGMLWFAIRPGLTSGQWTSALFNGAFLGFVAYATFDFTSQAVFKGWTWKLSIIDIAWGTFATGVTSALTAWLVLRFAKS